MKSIQFILFALFFNAAVAVSAQEIIPLKPYIENMKTIDVYINGKKYNFLFDTGGAQTIISPEIAQLLNKKIYGSSSGFRMDGEIIKAKKCDSISLKIGSTTLFHTTVSVWDIMSILPKDWPKIDGVIALKSFENKILTLELYKNIFTIENSISAKKEIKKKHLLKSRFANGLDGSELNVFIGIPKNNSVYWFLFDSGNGGPLLLSNESILAWGQKPDTKEEDFIESDFIIGKSKLRIKPFARKIIYDGVLNYEAISKYVFTIDLIKKEVWIN